MHLPAAETDTLTFASKCRGQDRWPQASHCQTNLKWSATNQTEVAFAPKLVPLDRSISVRALGKSRCIFAGVRYIGSFSADRNSIT